MLEHPELVAGERRRIDTALMRSYPGQIVSKGGAEGVLAMGLLKGATPDAPLGIAATIEDGNLGRRAGDVVSVDLLRQLALVGEIPDRLREFASPPITDPRGEASGEVRPAFQLS